MSDQAPAEHTKAMRRLQERVSERAVWRQLIEAVQRSDIDFLRGATAQGEKPAARIANRLADPRTGKTLMHYAAACHAKDVVRFLAAEPGCDFAAQDRKGRSPADIAYKNWGHTPVARYLLNRELDQRQRGPELANDPASREAAARQLHANLMQDRPAAHPDSARSHENGAAPDRTDSSRFAQQHFPVRPRDRDNERDR